MYFYFNRKYYKHSVTVSELLVNLSAFMEVGTLNKNIITNIRK